MGSLKARFARMVNDPKTYPPQTVIAGETARRHRGTVGALSLVKLVFSSFGGGDRLYRNVCVVAVKEFGLTSDDSVEDRASDCEEFGHAR